MSTASDPWGRVAEDGTVYVRTAEGERQVGSWQAGQPGRGAGLLQAQVRDAGDRGQPAGAAAGQHRPVPRCRPRPRSTRLISVGHRRHAIGDLAGLLGRLEALTGVAGHAQARSTGPRASRPAARRWRSRSGSSPRPSGIAAEATHWKISGERMRQLLEEWKAAPRGDRTAETALWKRLSAARNAFTKRRKAYFAEPGGGARGHPGAQGGAGPARPRRWPARPTGAATAAAYRELMRAWKQAGRADRATEDELWNRFKARPGHVLPGPVRDAGGQGRGAASRTRWPRSSCWPRRRSCCR